MMTSFLLKVFFFIKKRFEVSYEMNLRRRFKFDNSVRLFNPFEITLRGSIKIGNGSYINSGRILTGHSSKVEIGENCAIGHNVTISSITHDLLNPTGPNLSHVEKDIIIGNHVWIGSNVFIREGVSIGSNCVIGANSVVTKSFPGGSIIGGIPAKLIKPRESSKFDA